MRQQEAKKIMNTPLLSEHKHNKPVVGVDYAHVQNSITYGTTSNYQLPHVKHPKQSELRVSRIFEKTVVLVATNHGLTHVSAITLPIQLFSCTVYKLLIYSRNYSFYRNGNSANFFPRVCNGKKIKELFTPTWNGIAASVRRVSSAPVVIYARLPDGVQPTQTKEDGKKRKNTKTVMFFPRRNTNTKLLSRS